jgi:hypothetical protein
MKVFESVVPTIDLRSAWIGVRDQQARSSCLACAASDAHMYAHDLKDPLSADALFYHGVRRMPTKNPDAGLTFEVVEDALEVDGQCLEVEWPYPATNPALWQPPASISQTWYGDVDHRKSGSAGILAYLNVSMPVVIGLKLREGFRDVDAPDFIVRDEGAFIGGHAVLGVGLGKTVDGTQLVLVRTSWGFSWADGGCAWVDTGYIDAHLIGYAGIGAAKNGSSTGTHTS